MAHVILEPGSPVAHPTPAASAASAPQAAGGLAMKAPEGGSLADLCDVHRAPITFSCRDANCGTCAIEVLEGGAELLPADPDERGTLDRLGFPAAHRLVCRATMSPGPSVLRIRAVGVLPRWPH